MSTTNPNRVPEGTSEGGRFTVGRTNEPSTLASARAIASTAEPDQRRAQPTPQQKITDKLRGHKFYPPKRDLAKLPATGTYAETPLDEIPIQQHYFTRGGGANWYVAEYDPATGHAWGYADLTGQSGEWGSFDMVELEELRVGMTVIERDCYFSKASFGEISARGY